MHETLTGKFSEAECAGLLQTLSQIAQLLILAALKTCAYLAVDTALPTTYRMLLGGSPLTLGVSQQGTRCESGAAPQR